MPTTAPQAFTRRQQFLIAAHGPAIAARLIAEEKADFTTILSPAAAAALAKATSGAARESDYAAIAAAFFAKTFPAEKPAARNPDTMRWIIGRYLNETHNGKPILCEDLYKIGQQVRYFTGLKNSGALPAHDNITAYPDLKSLAVRLAPFEKKRQEREAERLQRHMPPAQRAQIMAETSIIHQSAAGTIVVPHTPFATQYWGNATKWCIAGQDNEDYFKSYNSRTPVIIFLPRDGEKMALVDHQYWDPADNSHDRPNTAVSALYDAAREQGSPAIARSLARWQPKRPEQEQEQPPIPPLPDLEDQQWVERIVVAAMNFSYIDVPAAVAKNPHIIKAAVTRDGRALSYADRTLQANPAIVMAAVTRDGSALVYADPALKANPAIVRAAVTQDGYALAFADPALLADPAIVMAAVAQTGYALLWAESSLQEGATMARYALAHATDYPETVLKIRKSLLCLDGIGDEEILAAQIVALQALYDSGRHDIAAKNMRHIKALWGQEARIFDDPAAQIDYLKQIQQQTVRCALPPRLPTLSS